MGLAQRGASPGGLLQVGIVRWYLGLVAVHHGRGRFEVVTTAGPLERNRHQRLQRRGGATRARKTEKINKDPVACLKEVVKYPCLAGFEYYCYPARSARLLSSCTAVSPTFFRSGEFHTYRAHRRREMHRVAAMDEEAKKEEATAKLRAAIDQVL